MRLTTTFRIGSILMGLALFLGLGQCRYQEERISEDGGLKLSFSQDSVLFDTVFTELRTVTKTFRVYNRAQEAVEIDFAQVAGGSNSPFEIWVNGQNGGSDRKVSQVLLRGGDSLRVLVEAKINGQDLNNPFLVQDSIAFLTNGNTQHVILQAYGRDAHYHRNETIRTDTNWRNDKPHIIIDQVFVDSNASLTLEAGTELYMQNYYVPRTGYRGANLFVEGILFSEGTCDEKVVVQGIRKEERFDNQPGQWGAIVLLPGGQADLKYTLIKEGFRGVQLGYPELDGNADLEPARLLIDRCEIRSMQDVGLLAYNGRMNMFNTIITDCAQRNMSLQKGGRYTILHSLFGYSDNFSFRDKPTGVYLSDAFFVDQVNAITDTLQVTFQNNIVDGPNESELLPFPVSNLFSADIRYNVIKYDSTQEGFPALDSSNTLLPKRYRNLGPDGDRTFTLNRMAFENKRDYDFVPDDSLTFRFFQNGQSYDTILLPPNINAGNPDSYKRNGTFQVFMDRFGRTFAEDLACPPSFRYPFFGLVPDAGPYESRTNP